MGHEHEHQNTEMTQVLGNADTPLYSQLVAGQATASRRSRVHVCVSACATSLLADWQSALSMGSMTFLRTRPQYLLWGGRGGDSVTLIHHFVHLKHTNKKTQTLKEIPKEIPSVNTLHGRAHKPRTVGGNVPC